MNTLIIILAVVFLSVLLYVGRMTYQRSVRIRNRLQMGQVFTNISHELLTPLTVISASVERMNEQEPRFAQDYALINLNIDRMVHLLQEILETSKSQSGELKLMVAQGDVMQYISRTAMCLEPLMNKQHIKFTVKCSPQSMMGWIDTDKLDKIIYNLLSNAAKYTQENGTVSLEVRTNVKYDHVIIKVKDDGIGIPKDKMKHLFQRFYDGNYRKMKTTGIGLGLALTRDLVYLHGGTIECESEEGKGTTFLVTIPINKEAFAPSQIDETYEIDFDKPQTYILDFDRLKPQEAEKQEESTVESPDEDIYHILIVEDNIELLMLMQTLLSSKYHIATAQNGREALEVIERQDLDLIISDVMMPEMDGNELTRRLKEEPNTSHLPIILLTAKTQDSERKESMLLGADDYITKPFKMGDLELRIKNIIENRKRIRREFKAQTVEESRLKAKTASPTADELFLQKAIDCVYAHLDDADFDRDAFASDMGTSASTLYNKLRSITGMNVSAFIRDIRMKEARHLAETEQDLRVSDLAYKVGFKDPKYFSTCFKKEFGLQPSEFIEQMEAR
jgi:CheY-like chemotaxis protein/nitrogen-specific signal transduction histidine kinase